MKLMSVIPKIWMFVLLVGCWMPMQASAELPPEVKKDQLLMALSGHLKKQQFKSALPYFDKLRELNKLHAVALPASLDFFEGEALHKTGDYEKAESLLTTYITSQGKMGNYYDQAVKLAMANDKKLEKQRKEHSAANAEQDRIAALKQYQQDELFKLPEGTLAGGFVLVPSGSFQMGEYNPFINIKSNDEPVHTVHIKAFGMSKYEITFDQFDEYCKKKRWSCDLPADRGWGRGNLPVINVSKKNAVSFAKWLSKKLKKRFRLPSESEWEYASRAGSHTPFGIQLPLSTDKANYNGEYDLMRHLSAINQRTLKISVKGIDRKKPLPVGSFSPNPLGLYDMDGNVAEIVADCYHSNYKNAPTDGSPWVDECGSRQIGVERGGSFSTPSNRMGGTERETISAMSDKSYETRTSFRRGFRLVQELD